jgi:hypothetical protein
MSPFALAAWRLKSGWGFVFYENNLKLVVEPAWGKQKRGFNMDELGERDAFVVGGTRVEIEKGQRYRILWRGGAIYEGTYLGFVECNPLCRTVSMIDVIQITESSIIADDEHMFYAFDKAGIKGIEKVEHDTSAMLKIIEPKSPDDNYGVGMN